MAQKYTDHITTQERLEVAKVLKAHPDLSTVLGEDWVRQRLLSPLVKRADVHPLFWILINPRKNEAFCEAFTYLKSQDNKYPSFIRDIRQVKTYSDCNALARELETYYLLSHDKSLPVEWKPRTKTGSGTLAVQPDLRLEYENKAVGLEVFTINDSKELVEEERAINELRAAVNAIEGNEYLIMPEFKLEFKKRYLPQCLRTIEDAIKKNTSNRFSVSFNYIERGVVKPVAQLEFIKATEPDKGQWGGHMYHTGFQGLGGKVKGKILQKLERFQFDPDIDEVKGYIIYSEVFGLDSYDFDIAILGTDALLVDRDSLDNARWVKNPNGLIHDPSEIAQRLRSEIDFIVFVESEHDKPDNEKYHFSINEKCPFTEDELKALFIDPGGDK